MSNTELSLARLFLTWKKSEVDTNNFRTPACGICYNFGEFVRCYAINSISPEDTADWLDTIFIRWPKFSGNLGHPVPCTEDIQCLHNSYEHYEAYTRIARIPGALWDSERPYAKLRHELVEFIASECEKFIENNQNIEGQSHDSL